MPSYSIQFIYLEIIYSLENPPSHWATVSHYLRLSPIDAERSWTHGKRSLSD